ncbi:MAG: LytTR family DNA-binding domain-containing protein [Chitinophagales bacterium]
MKVTCIIVDDMKLNRDVMDDLIAGVNFLTAMGSFSNAEAALNALNELEPDVVFLDIEMPGMNGLQFLNSIVHPPMAILTTSHRKYAVEGFEMNVFDYLLKPITRERFAKCAARLYRHFKTLKKPWTADQMFIKSGNKFMRVRISEILFVEAMRDFVMVHTEKARYMILQSLKEFSAHLPDDKFVRIHRSYTVPIEKIEYIEGNKVKIQNQEIPIGDSYRSSVLKLLLGRES